MKQKPKSASVGKFGLVLKYLKLLTVERLNGYLLWFIEVIKLQVHYVTLLLYGDNDLLGDRIIKQKQFAFLRKTNTSPVLAIDALK